MKILVVSDTHKNIENVIKFINSMNTLDMVIHLGDYVKDAEELSYIFHPLKFIYVSGNCDALSGEYRVEDEKLLKINGRNILLTHGHKYNVKRGFEHILRRAEELKADLVLYGHTHCADISNINGIVFFNPGSCSCPRDSVRPSVGMLKISDSIDCDILRID